MISQAQKMKQLQKLSPKQLMLMRLIQMPSMVLEQAIKEEIEKNPMLEVESVDDRETSISENLENDTEQDEVLDFFDEDYRGSGSYDRGNAGNEFQAVSEVSLMQTLQQQLGLLTLTERENIIAQEIIGSIDDAGYLSRDLALIENDLAFQQGIEATREELEAVLQKVQTLEPSGVGARTLQECLLIQLKRSNQNYEVKCAKAVLEQCFDAFMRQQYESIAETLEIDLDSVLAAKAVILRLNPKPCAGESFTALDTQYITPDFVVQRNEGNLSFTINDKNLPKLKMSKYYESMLQSMLVKKNPSPSEQETIDFLTNKNNSAQEFLDNVQQRRVTLQRTMAVILKRQRKYFLTGDPSTLKPFMQHEVAEEIGMDDSTISRVVNSKYVQTDFGTFPLKHFFSQASIVVDGDEVAVDVVKHRLKELLDAEDKSSPLTDEQLADLMKNSGYNLARRTVAKYRESLGIPTSRLRKIIKGMAFILCMMSSLLMAQTPMSYYDSLIYQQQHKSEKSVKQTPAKPSAERLTRKKLEPVDSNLLKSDDMIDKMYDASLRPSQMWYGKHFSASRVKPETFHIDSLPDAVNLRIATTDSDFCFPIKNILTSPYGWRWGRAHRGVDIRLNMGDPVHAAFAGVVRIASPMGAYGNLVVLRHYNGLETVYGHLSKLQVKPNQIVKAGDVIGLGGSTGRSTGPHLHFEVRFQYEPFDPEWLLDFSNYTLRTKHLHLDKTYFGISKPQNGVSLAYKADKSYVKEESKPRAQKREIFYVVGKDDTLESIAEYYRTTADKIKELNPNMTKLKKGLRIRVR